MSVLAVNGAAPLRTAAFHSWPVFGERDEQMLLDALHNGHWGLAGVFIPEFENRYSKMHQAKHGFCVCNGTMGLVVALKAAGVGHGDEVIIPSYTFTATASAVLEVGALPVFIDIDPITCCIDASKIEQAITPVTKAVIPVHIAGQPADMDAVKQVAGRYSLVVIEDSAQAHGAEWKGRKVGALGAIGAFSFQSSKNLAAGEGGIVLTNDDELADKCYSYINCGRTRSGISTDYFVVGQNYRITEFQAALLLSQLSRFDEQCHRRESNARYLSELLDGIEGVTAPGVDPRVTRHAWHLYMPRFDMEAFPGVTIDRISEALSAEGIPMRRGYKPLYNASMFTNGEAGCVRAPCPECEKACSEILWLSQHVLLGTRRDMEDIASAVKKVVDNIGELR